MAVDEPIQIRIRHKLEPLIGAEEADALVTHVFPTPGQEIATKHDVRLGAAELRTEMAGVRGEIAQLRGETHQMGGELRGEIQNVRSEMHQMGGELRGEIENVRGEMHQMGGGLRGEIEKVRAEIHAVVTSQTRWMIGFIMSWSVIVLTAVRLFS